MFLVPDIHIDGRLSAVHLMLDKRQLEIIKGLIDMNLGEHIEEFEKPSSVILDPVAQVSSLKSSSLSLSLHCSFSFILFSFPPAYSSCCMDWFQVSYPVC